jgi:hypothetical protein
VEIASPINEVSLKKIIRQSSTGAICTDLALYPQAEIAQLDFELQEWTLGKTRKGWQRI